MFHSIWLKEQNLCVLNFFILNVREERLLGFEIIYPQEISLMCIMTLFEQASLRAVLKNIFDSTEKFPIAQLAVVQTNKNAN